MSKRINTILGVLSLFNENFDLDKIMNDKYFGDPEVMDCQINLYLFLICDDENEREKFLNKASEVYFKLSEEKQEYVKQDIMHIFEEQEKNMEKEKNTVRIQSYRWGCLWMEMEFPLLFLFFLEMQMNRLH